MKALLKSVGFVKAVAIASVLSLLSTYLLLVGFGLCKNFDRPVKRIHPDSVYTVTSVTEDQITCVSDPINLAWPIGERSFIAVLPRDQFRPLEQVGTRFEPTKIIRTDGTGFGVEFIHVLN